MGRRKKKRKSSRRARGTGTIFSDARRGGWTGKVPAGRYPNGRTRYVQVSAPTQGEVVELMKLVRPPGPTTTVAEWADRWLAECDARPSTRDDYRHTVAKYVKPTLGHFPVAALTAGDVERAVKRWTATLGPNTARKDLGHLVTMLDAARRSGLGGNVAADAKRPRSQPVDVRPFPPEVLRSIIAAAGDAGTDAPFALLAAVGCRLGEALALDVGDFDPVAGRVAITKTYSARHGVRPPKSVHGVRTIRVPAPALPALCRAAGTRVRGPLFAGTGGGRRQHSSLQRRWKGFLAALGVEYRNLHQLRHSVATALVSAGVPLGDAAKFLGDTVEVVVRRYVRAAGTDPAAAMERLFDGDRRSGRKVARVRRVPANAKKSKRSAPAAIMRVP
jgi:integrase